ncbi:hypothetical protein ACFV4N_37185 [Actinosynnema sp. NPDC059797]
MIKTGRGSGTRGRAGRQVSINPAQWPGRVVPESEADVEAAVASLCLRAGWADADHGRLRRTLEPWFTAGWCVDAVLRAVDLTPDGRLQLGRRAKDQHPHDFVRNRLRAWFDERDHAVSATERAAPPVDGMSYGQWWRINRRNARVNQPRQDQPRLGEAGRQARDHVHARARSSRRDPIAAVREKGRRAQEALDSLLVPDLAPPSADDPHPHPSSPHVRDHVARQQAVANDLTVRRALAVVLSQDRPTTEAVTVLHNAVRTAKKHVGLAALEALTDHGDARTTASP